MVRYSSPNKTRDKPIVSDQLRFDFSWTSLLFLLHILLVYCMQTQGPGRFVVEDYWSRDPS